MRLKGILVIRSGQLVNAGTVSGKPECMVTLIIMVPTSSGVAKVKSLGKVSDTWEGLYDYLLLFTPKIGTFPVFSLLLVTLLPVFQVRISGAVFDFLILIAGLFHLCFTMSSCAIINVISNMCYVASICDLSHLSPSLCSPWA